MSTTMMMMIMLMIMITCWSPPNKRLYVQNHACRKNEQEVPLLAKNFTNFCHFNRNSHLDFVHNKINIIKMCILFTVINRVKGFNIYIYSKIILRTIHATEKLKSMFCNIFHILFFFTLHCKLNNNVSLVTVLFSLNMSMNKQNHSPAITDNGQPQ